VTGKKDIPPSPSITRYYSNSVKSEYFEFKLMLAPGKTVPDTSLNGVSMQWDSSGRMRSRQHYKNGKRDGDRVREWCVRRKNPAWPDC
jgi:antitoxin component YwqK of YwqJK toxin-antitoxin module